MAFCWKCEYCGATTETLGRQAPQCDHGGAFSCGEDLTIPMVRDWRAEGVGVGTGVRVSRDGTLLDQARLFLPTNDEFKGPGDPDGTKGMRAWHERHAPAEGNKNPVLPGHIDRRSF